MPWVKLDDRFHSNLKVMGCSLEAIGLYTLALSWAGQELTNGRVPFEFAELRANGRHRDLAAELCARGLWSEDPSGWKINDYLKFNPSKAQVEKRRRDNRKAGRIGGLASGEARGKQT